METAKMLSICFLGKSRLEYDGKKFEDQFGNKVIALICLLVLNEKRYLSREKIEGYLWPESNEEAAKYNLRYNLWLLKKILMPDDNGEQFLKIDKEYCSINVKYSFNCDILQALNFVPNKNDTIMEISQNKLNLYFGFWRFRKSFFVP